MSFWKIAGGIAAGIGTVACLPVAGAIGTVTLIGAVVGGTVGGIAGVAVSASDDEKEAELNDNYKKVMAEKNKQEKKFKELYEAQNAKFEEIEDHYNFLIALVATGMAAANADGNICPEEKDAIDSFVIGLSQNKLPVKVKNKIEKLCKTPPSLNTVYKLAEKVKDVDWKLFEYIIKIVINADGTLDEKENAFLDAFRKKIA